MEMFLIINGVLLVLMIGGLVWVRAQERKQKAAKAAQAEARERQRAVGGSEAAGKEGEE